MESIITISTIHIVSPNTKPTPKIIVSSTTKQTFELPPACLFAYSETPRPHRDETWRYIQSIRIAGGDGTRSLADRQDAACRAVKGWRFCTNGSDANEGMNE